MKKIFIAFIACFACLAASAQEFTKHLAEARTAYAAGKLDDSRFAMQQMLQELDLIAGKDVLKLLPTKMLDQNVRTKKDEVSGASGFVGVLIHREYGPEIINGMMTDSIENVSIVVEIISNSPLVGTLNSLLSLPFMSNPDQKVVKVSGYKALLQKVSGPDDELQEYELQLPLQNSLLTIKAPGRSQDQILKMAGTLPMSEIAKMIQ
jgi:hypothetical protein